MPRSVGAWVGIGVLVLLVGVAVLRVVQAGSPDEAAPTVEEIRETGGIPVAVQTAEVGTLEVWRNFSGTVSGVRDAVVRARSSNQVTEVPVAVGQRVARDQTLVRVSGEAIQARVRQAESALRQAERLVERLEPLHEAGAISDQEWENALTQRDVARDDLAAAREGLELTSPLAGTVTEVPARPGMIPDVGDPLVRVADLSRLVVRLQLSASDARQVEVGQPARIAGEDIAGEVGRVALQADPVTRLVEVEVGFPEGSGLVPGTLEQLEIRVASRDEAVQVPRAAIRDGAVWVIDGDDRATRRPVEVGLQTPTMAEVTMGIDPGERVVVQGASLLGEGALVRIVGDLNGAAPTGGR